MMGTLTAALRREARNVANACILAAGLRREACDAASASRIAGGLVIVARDAAGAPACAGALSRGATHAARAIVRAGALAREARIAADATAGAAVVAVVIVGRVAVAGAVEGFPGRIIGLASILSAAAPVNPVRVPVRSAKVHVLDERNDRNIDVTRLGHGALKLAEQALGRGLQGGHFAGVGHRSRVVEHKRDAQPPRTPLGSRRRVDVERVIAKELGELGV